MALQKAIWVYSKSDLKELNEYLSKGWIVKSVTSQNVSTAAGGETGSSVERTGSFLVIIEWS